MSNSFNAVDHNYMPEFYTGQTTEKKLQQETRGKPRGRLEGKLKRNLKG